LTYLDDDFDFFLNELPILFHTDFLSSMDPFDCFLAFCPSAGLPSIPQLFNKATLQQAT
jgi:hypothetical protein